MPRLHAQAILAQILQFHQHQQAVLVLQSLNLILTSLLLTSSALVDSHSRPFFTFQYYFRRWNCMKKLIIKMWENSFFKSQFFYFSCFFQKKSLLTTSNLVLSHNSQWYSQFNHHHYQLSFPVSSTSCWHRSPWLACFYAMCAPATAPAMCFLIFHFK